MWAVGLLLSQLGVGPASLKLTMEDGPSLFMLAGGLRWFPPQDVRRGVTGGFAQRHLQAQRGRGTEGTPSRGPKRGGWRPLRAGCLGWAFRLEVRGVRGMGG